MEETIVSPKLKWEKFEPQFGTWAPLIKPFFDKGGFEPIYSRLKERGQQGKVICPRADNTFRAFRETPYKSLKVVIMGMCPYHTIIEERGVKTMVADGLAVSCGNHEWYKAPSLENLYTALEEEFEGGLCIPCLRPQSLLYLASQGVLLTNAQLTTEVGKPGIHEDLWRPFTKYMVEEVYSKTAVPMLFMGQVAQYFERFKAPMQWSFDVSHPASAAYKGTRWDSEKVFEKIQKILVETTGDGVQWLIEEELPF